MPTWMIQAGHAPGEALTAGTTEHGCPMGNRHMGPDELYSRLLARGSYTSSGLSVRVKANACAADSTIRSRINAAFGNQIVTIGAGATGLFNDDINSDALVDGDLFTWRYVAGAGGAITHSLVTSLLAAATNIPIIAAVNRTSASTDRALRYCPIFGEIPGGILEVHAQYRFRAAATLSNLRCRIWANTFDAATAVWLRVAGAPGNQNFNIGAGATGEFEDVVNTDAIAVGTLVAIETDASAATVGSQSLYILQLKSASLSRQVVSISALLTNIAFGLTLYCCVEGSSRSFDPTELNAQGLARTAFTARNMCACVKLNTINAVCTIRMRKSTGVGGYGNLNVTIGALATGIFEDLANSDTFVPTDLLDWELVTGGLAGNLQAPSVGYQQDQPVAAASGSVVPLCVAAGMF